MAERVIWERTVDQNKIRERSDRFRKRFLPAAGLILLIVLVVTGWQNAIGALFVVGLVGMVWGNMVRYQSLSDAANPVMTVTDGRLKLGDRTVIIEDVKRFTTIATSLQTSLFGRHSRIHLGKAIFRMDMPGSRGGPDLVEFGWPNMTEKELPPFNWRSRPNSMANGWHRETWSTTAKCQNGPGGHGSATAAARRGRRPQSRSSWSARFAQHDHTVLHGRIASFVQHFERNELTVWIVNGGPYPHGHR